MASLEQWTKWREEYYAGLKQIIDDAPYGMAKLTVEAEGDHFFPDVAKAFVDKAIKEGFINESEPLSFLKMSYFAMVGLVAYQNKEDVSVQDVEASCHEPDYPYREITTADDYISYSLWAFHLPFLKACRYVFANHPRACKNVIIDLFKQAGEEIDFSYFRLRKEELFNYFRSITPFCLHNMLADMNCPYAEEVFDAVQDGDYEFFKTLCYEKNIDFTELSEIVGYLQGGLIGSINDTEKFFESDENPDEETGEKIYLRLKNVTSMAGLPRFNQEDFKAGVTILKQNIVGELLPFIQTEEDASIISAIAFDVASMYSYIERMDDGELKEINRLLDHPDFEALVKLAQVLFCGRYDRFPNNVIIHFSPEEQDEIAKALFNSDSDKESLAFTLPTDFFDLPLDRSASDEYFDVEYAVEKGGTKRFTRFLNYIASQGYIEYSNRSKQLLAYILTGRWKPADYQRGEAMAWHDYGHEGKELCYIIKSLVASDQGKKATKYDKMHKLFTGPNWSNSVPDKDQGNNAQKKFKEALNDLYPDICKL